MRTNQFRREGVKSIGAAWIAVIGFSIVVCDSLWLHAEWTVVKTRLQLRMWVLSHGAIVVTHEDRVKRDVMCGPIDSKLCEGLRFPFVRTWLGDEPIFYVNLVRTNLDWADRQRIASTFPEAWVMPEHANGFRDNEESSAVRRKTE
jgi:hypothetical protein